MKRKMEITVSWDEDMEVGENGLPHTSLTIGEGAGWDGSPVSRTAVIKALRWSVEQAFDALERMPR